MSSLRRLLTWPNAVVILGMATVFLVPPLGLILVAAGIWIHYLGSQVDHDGRRQP